MANPSPLSTPTPWNLVAPAYIDEIAPLLADYARDALRFADLAPGDRVLDVAAGPGTLSLLAAETAGHVVAADFSDDMLTILRRRVAEAGHDHVEAHVADGQSLPFADASFDAAFSMFGLMFFPDRAAGFREMHRVLVPGGRAVVSSWSPSDQIPLIATVFDAIREGLPDLPFGDDRQPLAYPEELRTEMSAAGFRDVEVHTTAHRLEKPSPREFWDAQQRASAPIVLLRQSRPEQEWTDLSEQIVARLEHRFGSGPVHLEWPAHLGVGTR